MKYAVFFLATAIAFSPAAFAQPPKTKPTPTKTNLAAKPKPKPTATPLTEKEQFDKASGYELASDRVAALNKFLVDFPQSENRPAAAELLASSRLLIAEEKLLSNDAIEATAIYRQVIDEYPGTFPTDLYNDSISKIPLTLFSRGQRTAAAEIASLIETKVESNAAQLLELANFYIRIENGGEAMRIAAKAAAKDPSSAAVYRTLGLAQRINFDLELAADSYAKSLELEPDSIASKRGLAEMKRALGKSDEAVVLYRDLLAKNENDAQARNGLILSLFESGKRADAETQLAAALEKSPNNVTLLAGVAYWYASHGVPDKAVELAQNAIKAEPRYIWSYIALGRGLMGQGKPVAAEQVLIRARTFGNFPTLEYELASSRIAAGFFREAVDDLSKQFSVTEAGVKTRLGGRIERVEKSLADLAAAERRSSIFAYDGADSTEGAEQLKALLVFDQKLQASEPSETEIAAAADDFARGTDKMRYHRQIFAASEMLQKKVALAKVVELTKAATGNADAALGVADPGAAVMASELYEPRQAAFKKSDFLLVPTVPQPTLSAIFRTRIEELAGWALYQQGNYADATFHLRRAVSVAPAKSAWWRSSMWRLGSALAADGKDAEGLNAMIESYKTDRPDYAKYVIVETLYKKVNNGSTEGLEAKVGADRVAGVVGVPTEPLPSPTPSAEPTPTPTTTNVPTPERKFVFPRGVPVATERKSEEDAPPPPPLKIEPGSSGTPVPEAKKEEPQLTDTKKQDAVVETNKEEPKPEPKKDEAPTVDVKKDEPSMVDTKKTDASTEVKKDEPSPTVTEQKKEEPPPTVTEQKKEEPPATVPEPKKDEPPVTDQKKDEPPPSVPEQKKDEPSPAVTAQNKEEPPPAVPEQRKNEPTTTEPKKDEPAPIAQSKKDEPPPTVEVKTTETVKTSGTVDDAKAAARKPLFDPIVITIPDSRRAKPTTDPGKAKDADTTSASGTERPRVIEGQEVKQEEIAPCVVGVSQESISLINGGGTVGILVNVEKPGEIKDINATSSSAKDIEIKAEPEISGIPDRRFFVIRSISSTLGTYQVSFTLPCGKKDVAVTVR